MTWGAATTGEHFVASNPVSAGSRDIGKGGLWYNVLNYGAIGDAITDAACAMTSGQSTLTTTTSPGPFTAAMVGRKVTVANALSASNPGGSGSGTVTAFNSATSLAVSFTCTNTVSGVKALICTQDDTTAIQAAITAAQNAGGGTVYFPTGGYVIQPQSAAATDALTITKNNIRLLGAGRGITRLLFTVYNLLDPVTNWQNNGGLVLRGNGVKMLSSSTTVPLSNITFEDFTLDGWSGYTGNRTAPANISTGDGWDTTNKGICRFNTGGVLYDLCYYRNIEISHWRGECQYGGGDGLTLGKTYIYDCQFNDSNGDGMAESGELYAERNHIFKHAANGVDNSYSLRQEVINNWIHDCDVDGIQIYSINGSSVGPVYVERNRLLSCARTGINMGATFNGWVRFNDMIDCGYSANNQASIYCYQSPNWGSSTTKGLHVTDNQMWANAQNLNHGIALVSGSTTFDDIEVDRNSVGVTNIGAAAGKTFNDPLFLSGNNPTNARIVTPFGKGTAFTYTDQAYAYESLLATTSATDVVKVRPAFAGMFRVSVYFRVITAPTNVTVNVTYYDATGAQITVNVLTITSEAVGSYRFAPLFVAAQGATESQYIKVTVTAGTANQVFVTASIKEDK